MLLIPDLIGYWLTGETAAEETNASTTGLLDPATREWAWDLIETLGWSEVALPGAAAARARCSDRSAMRSRRRPASPRRRP